MTRKNAIKQLKMLKEHLKNDMYADDVNALNTAIQALEQEPKTGHWIMSDDGLYRPICDKCGAHPWKGYIPTVEEVTEVFKYCPNCGARMESEVRNE